MLHTRLKARRKEKGLSQEYVAEKLGITRQGYGHYETGRNEPDSKTIIKLAQILECSTDYLHGVSDQPNRIDNEYDPVGELKQYLIENNMTEYGFGFYDVEQWKKLGPEEIEEVKRHFDYVVAKAEQMKKEEEERKKKD